jgi:hypothetical protein
VKITNQRRKFISGQAFQRFSDARPRNHLEAAALERRM